MPASAAPTEFPRIHDQWLPDELRIEAGLGLDTIRLLRDRGYLVVERDAMGGTQSVLLMDGRFHGASDPRRPGGLTAGF